ncbi:DUF5819 family protein [Microbacterium sp. NC79]|uniref:DUF5819 family protein n=1 Tax=Microbacterium sp. NC79 TaxID=2851009 RepID=UPI001C2C52E8|nr:DUF5819 family protein [Microbacterium sp. NC79]MBV0894342.1 hypothetical protein [Microbacterium sp. NC79]
MAEKKARPPALRVLLVLASAFTAWHVFASFLWIAPYSPLREVVPTGALHSYMIPMFGQSWSVFAPEPINGSYGLNVRAVEKDESGEETVTDWVSATDVELSMIQYNLFPPRAGIQAAQLASEFKGSFDGLTDDHRVIAGLNYFEADWEARMEEKMASYGSEKVVTTYMQDEHMMTAYATQVALAMWGDDVVRIQYQVTRQNVIPFASRNDPAAVPPAMKFVETGWRGLIFNPGQSNENFSDVFRAQWEKIS